MRERERERERDYLFFFLRRCEIPLLLPFSLRKQCGIISWVSFVTLLIRQWTLLIWWKCQICLESIWPKKRNPYWTLRSNHIWTQPPFLLPVGLNPSTSCHIPLRHSSAFKTPNLNNLHLNNLNDADIRWPEAPRSYSFSYGSLHLFLLCWVVLFLYLF